MRLRWRTSRRSRSRRSTRRCAGSRRSGGRRADARGARLDVLSFGQTDLEPVNGRVLHHAGTEGMVDRHPQARHVAIVADGQHALWALAADGRQWDAVVAADPLLAAVVKGYVRHDMYVYFREELERRYGPAERDHSAIVHWTEYDKGGHHAAQEEPQLLADDIRTFFAARR